MSTLRWLGAASALVLTLAACESRTNNSSSATAETAEIAEGKVAALADVPMNVDTSYLSAEEKEVVNLLIQAAQLMNPIYLRQVSAANPQVRAEIEKSGDKAALARFDQMRSVRSAPASTRPTSPRSSSTNIWPPTPTRSRR
jgi:hypothetical protein